MLNIKAVISILLLCNSSSSVFGQAVAKGGASLHDLIAQINGNENNNPNNNDSDITGLINSIFTPPTTNDGGSVTSTSSSIIQTTSAPEIPVREGGGSSGDGTGQSSGCTCVPYYLCNNGTINTDGAGVIDIRINDGPCQNYLEVCCDDGSKAVDPITPTPAPYKRSGCGFRNPDGIGFRISGDKDNEAQFGEFPWMVAVLNEETVGNDPKKLNVYQCGGALVHPQVVVTAAHCVSNKNKSYKIRAGEWDTQHTQELYPYQDRDVKTVVVHPQYYAGALFNDIAVLYLESPVEIAENVNTICLPPQDTVINADTVCYATGWGKDVFGLKGKYQVILKKIDLPIVANDRCQDLLRGTRLGKHFQLHRSFLCAGGIPGKDTCKGDGGSPLVCPINGEIDRYYQVGIVAWGIGCGEHNTPGVYVNIPLFREWIDTQVKSFGLESSAYQF